MPSVALVNSHHTGPRCPTPIEFWVIEPSALVNSAGSSRTLLPAGPLTRICSTCAAFWPRSIDHIAVGQRVRGDRPVNFKFTDGGRGAGKPLEFSAGTVHDQRGFPFGSVKIRLVPVRLHEPRIKILAAVNRGKGDRAGRGAPLVVGANGFNRAVSVFEADLGDGLERAERAFEFGEAVRRRGRCTCHCREKVRRHFCPCAAAT